MKKIIRNIVRKHIGARENETIADSLNRKKYNFLKKINRKKFSQNDFKRKLENLGLKKDDIVIVHCAWRAFIGFDGKPEDVINIICEIVGKNGTVLMPAFTNNRNEFHYEDVSCAGGLSEIFRKNYNVIRSLDTNFSMIGIGKDANDLLKDHIKSRYYFDENSPYYKAIHKNAKILLLGLGNKPHKITLFHCITYELRNLLECYKKVYTLERQVKIYNKNNEMLEKTIIDRRPLFQNNKRKFKKLFAFCISKENYEKNNYLDIYLFEAKKVYISSKDYIKRRRYCLYS